MRACSKCSRSMSLESFSKDRTRGDGISSQCRECVSARNKDRYERNKASLLTRQAAYYERHKDECQERMRSRYQSRKEDYKAQAKAWAAANPEKSKEISRAKYARDPAKARARWVKRLREHPELFAARSARKRAALLRATPKWANADAIKGIYRESRRLTEETGVKHHVDHIVPLISPVVCGLHVPWNLRPIPAVDNLRKTNRFRDDKDAK